MKTTAKNSSIFTTIRQPAHDQNEVKSEAEETIRDG
jgi:hypothetical protein